MRPSKSRLFAGSAAAAVRIATTAAMALLLSCLAIPSFAQDKAAAPGAEGEVPRLPRRRRPEVRRRQVDGRAGRRLRPIGAPQARLRRMPRRGARHQAPEEPARPGQAAGLPGLPQRRVQGDRRQHPWPPRRGRQRHQGLHRLPRQPAPGLQGRRPGVTVVAGQPDQDLRRVSRRHDGELRAQRTCTRVAEVGADRSRAVVLELPRQARHPPEDRSRGDDEPRQDPRDLRHVPRRHPARVGRTAPTATR